MGQSGESEEAIKAYFDNELQGGKRTLSKDIVELIGMQSKSWCSRSREVRDFRRTMKKVRTEEGWLHTKTVEFLTETGTSAEAQAFRIRFTFSEDITKVFQFKTNNTVKEVKEDLVRKSRARGHHVPDPDQLVFKVTGKGEYLLTEENELARYVCVQEALKKRKELGLTVATRSNLPPHILDKLDHKGDAPPQMDKENLNFIAEDVEEEDVRRGKTLFFGHLARPLRVRVQGVDNIGVYASDFLKQNTDQVTGSSLVMEASVWHGGVQIGRTARTSPQPFSLNPRWFEWLTFDIRSISLLPHATRVCFTLYLCRENMDDVPLGWCNHMLINHQGVLNTGVMGMGMWKDDTANPIGCVAASLDKWSVRMFIELDTYAHPIVFPRKEVAVPPLTREPRPPPDEERAMLERLISKTALHVLTEHEKKACYTYRHWLAQFPRALSKFLASVDWCNNPAQVKEAHIMLRRWAELAPMDALELLDSKFPDAEVRDYAIERLEEMPDSQLMDFVLQLTQTLKYESYHDSSLARFLLRRGLSNPHMIGHMLFWYLKSQMHVGEVQERYGLLLEEYIISCGATRKNLLIQNDVCNKLIQAALYIKELDKEKQNKLALQEKLRKMRFPPRFRLPLDPRLECKGLMVEKCKFMDSKKKPLWLVFENADPMGKPITVIFKEGDDLRQDLLTLQVLKIMDNIWMAEGLDLRLNVYGCMTTGDEQGFIEVVLNSETTAAITRAAGGAMAAFKSGPMGKWLRQQVHSEREYRRCVDNFVYSTAGYCVATYVLGIGDRHNDNIMCTRDGHLFHIDFGHFLGNYKSKFGFKRERAPFVLTPDFVHVMGGKGSPEFERFLELCAKAYNILRKHAHSFINLFALMISTGIPELRSLQDIRYLRDAFALDCTERQAAQKFTDLVYQSIGTKTTQVNNMIHILAH